jgi:SAM-dependent methyltransferase
MLRILNKIQFSQDENRMKALGNVDAAIKLFEENKSTNLEFLLKERFLWMNDFIKSDDIGVELGAGPGFSKKFIKCKNFKISDLSNHNHLDYKKVDAQNTKFKEETFDFVIASNMVHHIPYPIKFFKEVNRILKRDGKLIIFEPYSSITLQLITMVMKHEGFNFTMNVWDEENPKSNEHDLWAGNIAVPHLIFDDKSTFNKNLGNIFEIKYEKLSECLIFLNSGGVSSKTFYIPMNNFFNNFLNIIDKILIKIFPKIFAMGRKLVLVKK